MQKLSALSRLRCLPEVKHFKTLETDEGLSSELVRRTALIEDVSRLINKAEADVSRAFSLKTKFMWNVEKVEAKASNDDKEAVVQQMKTFVKELYSKPEVAAIGGNNYHPFKMSICVPFNFTKFESNHFVISCQRSSWSTRYPNVQRCPQSLPNDCR